VFRSPIAHGRITHLDVSAAEAMDGVVSVLVGSDLIDIDPFYGHAIRDRPIVALDRVRFIGEPIAAVAAKTMDQAEAAARQIVVKFEELPVVANLDAALATDAPIIHDGRAPSGFAHGLGKMPDCDGNICYSYALNTGDLGVVSSPGDIVIDHEYVFPAVYQYSMETHAVIAEHTGTEIRLWANCQHPFLVQSEIATLFNLPISSVRINVQFLGGGFGSKSYTKMEPLAVALARKAKKPVRIVNEVSESMVTTRRHNMKCRMVTTAKSTGELVSRDVQVWLDTGAYADNGPRVTATAGDAASGPYRWQATKVRAHCVYTNTGPSGSYRAFGATHLQWVGESQIDEVARRAGLDPLEVRRRNLLRRGEVVRINGKPLDADLIGDIEKVAAALGWGEERKPNRGRGISVGLLAAGAHPVSMATVRMDVTAGVSVLVGSTEMGQGTRTVMAQIVAQVLTVPMSKISVPGTDTRFTPYDRSTGASRSTTVAGRAVELAALEVRASLLETAGQAFGVYDTSTLRVENGGVTDGKESMTFGQIITKRFGFAGGELVGHGEVKPEGGSGSYEEGPVFWEVCIAGAEVEVDRNTGVVKIIRTVSVADVGRAINPTQVERQDEGATLQGIGNAMFEEMLYSTDGYLLNDTLLEYRIPTMLDMPELMKCIIVENEDGPGPFGSKGCGEGALAAIPAAIVNALGDIGIDMYELPLTPERVWNRIQQIQRTK
jgi:CO/xanthine dehydrogenase Mo-binding subunit